MPIINTVIQGGGTTPTGTKSITANGVYDVTDFASADVQVPTTAPAHYVEKTVDANGKLISGTQMINLNGVSDLGNFVLAYGWYYNSGVSGVVDLSSLTSISGSSALERCFSNCPNLTGVNLSSLQTITGGSALTSCFDSDGNITFVDLSSLQTINSASGMINCFRNCTKLDTLNISSLKDVNGASALSYALLGTKITTLDLSKLTTLLGRTPTENFCASCTSLTSVNISSLVTLGNNYGSLSTSFYNCSALTGMIFDSLKYMAGANCFYQTFGYDSSFSSLSFPALTPSSFGSVTNQFNRMLLSVTGCTVHFPSNLQSVIGSWSDVTAGFGGTNTTVLFDLPSTAHLTGANTVEYERNPKYDTGTALAWRVKDTGTNDAPVIDWTPFYTSGTTDPTVGTTIYSDSACTTAVTTISSIA